MNKFSHLPENVFDLLNRWSYLHNLEVLILEMSNMSDGEKTSVNQSLTLITCNFNAYFSTLKLEFARAELFIENN